jgi:integrase
MAVRLHTRDARKKLAPRDKPYWQEHRRGLHIGYRRGTEGGSWLMREFNSRAGKDLRGGYVQRRLGIADDTVASDGVSVLSWEDAQRKASGGDRPTITKPGKYTVAEAAQVYFDTRSATTPHDKVTWNRFIKDDLGDRVINELVTGDIERWLSAQVPATDDKDKRRAARATANRRYTVLRAILNSAYRKNSARVPSADAWRRIRPFQDVDSPRQRFLSADEARRLLSALQPALRVMARAALYTGCRLGELLGLNVADVVDARVHVRHSKSGRSRVVPLDKEGARFFEETIADKQGDATVFPTADGKAWVRVGISRAMRAACTAAKISPPATFHDLRRSYGSLMLNAGSSAEHIQRLLGHADLRMTTRAYAHLLDATLQKSVEKHLPSFKPDEAVKMKRRKTGLPL